MYYLASLRRHPLWLRSGSVERFAPALEVAGTRGHFRAVAAPGD